jgi:hypothetical protein
VCTCVRACSSYLGLGDKGAAGDGESAVHGAEVLGHDGQTAPLSAGRAGRQPLGGRGGLAQVSI